MRLHLDDLLVLFHEVLVQIVELVLVHLGQVGLLILQVLQLQKVGVRLVPKMLIHLAVLAVVVIEGALTLLMVVCTRWVARVADSLKMRIRTLDLTMRSVVMQLAVGLQVIPVCIEAISAATLLSMTVHSESRLLDLLTVLLDMLTCFLEHLVIVWW